MILTEKLRSMDDHVADEAALEIEHLERELRKVPRGWREYQDPQFSECVIINKTRLKLLDEKMEKMETLLKSAVEVFESNELKGVMIIAHVHNCPYSGPQFDLEKAKEILNDTGRGSDGVGT